MTERGCTCGFSLPCPTHGNEDISPSSVEDYGWALDRVTRMCASALVDAQVYRQKLLKGFGYPNETFSRAQDYRALSIILSALQQAQAPQKVTRFEVVDDSGRVLTRYVQTCELSYQDDGRTLKVFLSGKNTEAKAENARALAADLKKLREPSPPRQEIETLRRLVRNWRALGASTDTWHATMGTGWKACADELESILAGAPRERGQPIETAPKDGSWMWARFGLKNQRVTTLRFAEEMCGGMWMSGTGYWHDNGPFTHWAPLNAMPPALPAPPAPPAEGIESALNRLDRLAAGIVPPCPECVSEYGHVKPDCPMCKGSGVCPSAAPPAEGRTE